MRIFTDVEAPTCVLHNKNFIQMKGEDAVIFLVMYWLPEPHCRLQFLPWMVGLCVGCGCRCVQQARVHLCICKDVHIAKSFSCSLRQEGTKQYVLYIVQKVLIRRRYLRYCRVVELVMHVWYSTYNARYDVFLHGDWKQ